MEWTPIKSSHRKSTAEKKILPLLLLGIDLETFRSRNLLSEPQTELEEETEEELILIAYMLMVVLMVLMVVMIIWW